MSELMVTKEKVLEAAEKCEEAKKVLKTLFPEVFEPEWKSFIPVVKVHDSDTDGRKYSYFYLYEPGDSNHFATVKQMGVDINSEYIGTIRVVLKKDYPKGAGSADEYYFERLVKKGE